MNAHAYQAHDKAYTSSGWKCDVPAIIFKHCLQ